MHGVTVLEGKSRLAGREKLQSARVDQPGMATQSRPGQPLDLNLATRGIERLQGSGAQDLRIISVSYNHTATFGPEILLLKRCAVKLRGQTPIETVTKIEVIGPFVVTQQVSPDNLDFDDYDVPLAIYSHQIGAAAIAQRHFGQAPDIIAREQAAYPARNRQSVNSAAALRDRINLRDLPIRHSGKMEQSANMVKPAMAEPMLLWAKREQRLACSMKFAPQGQRRGG